MNANIRTPPCQHRNAKELVTCYGRNRYGRSLLGGKRPYVGWNQRRLTCESLQGPQESLQGPDSAKPEDAALPEDLLRRESPSR